MNKKKIFIICGLIIISIVVLFVVLGRYDTSVERYIKAIGFKKSDLLYEKKISGVSSKEYYASVENKVPSESKYLYFDLNRSLLTYINMNYSLDLQYTFSGKYYYKTDSLSYRYEVSDDKLSAMVQGKRLKESDSCSCEVAYLNNARGGDSETYSLICEQARLICNDFDFQTKTLISNASILEKIKA